MNGRTSVFLALALPVFLLLSLSQARFALAWTDIFSSIWNSIWNAISGIFHISTVSAQQQFANRLTQLQDNETPLAQFYLANVGKYASQYNVSVNTSWSVQVTDVNSSTSPVIGRLTITWNYTAKSLNVHSGIVSAPGVPAFAVNMTHSTFLALSRDVVDQNIDGAIADFGIAEATHSTSFSVIP